MNAKLVDWATRQEVRPASVQLVLIHLARLADEDLSCAVSIRVLAAKTNLGISTVRRCLQRLERGELITRREQLGDDGSQLINRYRVNLPETRPRPRPIERKNDVSPAFPLELDLGLSPVKLEGMQINPGAPSTKSRRGAR